MWVILTDDGYVQVMWEKKTVNIPIDWERVSVITSYGLSRETFFCLLQNPKKVEEINENEKKESKKEMNTWVSDRQTASLSIGNHLITVNKKKKKKKKQTKN